MWVGAHLSARAPGGLVRRALAFVLLASALKLLNVSNADTGIVLLVVASSRRWYGCSFDDAMAFPRWGVARVPRRDRVISTVSPRRILEPIPEEKSRLKLIFYFV